MNLTEWRKANIHTMELSSGLTVTLKKISVVDVMLSGKIPTTLHTTVDAMSAGSMKPTDLMPVQQIIDAVARACLVDPPLAPDGQPGDDERLSLTEMSLDDKFEIFNWANQGVMALRPFRAQQEADVEPARNGDGVPDAALASGGDR